MRTAITLTDVEANQLLALLQDLPIRYLPIVTSVQQFLMQKFERREEPEYAEPVPCTNGRGE